MAFKINVSHRGKTFKVETESEVLAGKKIGDKVKGEDVDASLKGYELEVTGASDLSGIPGFKGLEGGGYHRRLLTRGPGMRDTRKGIRLRKTNRGEEISLKTHQINIKVLKEGETKFDGLVSGEKKEEGSESGEEKGEEKEEGGEGSGEEKVEEVKEEKVEEAPKEDEKEEKKESEEKKE